MLNRCETRREKRVEEINWVKRDTEGKRGNEETFHWTNFNLSLLAGQCCNKLQVVKGLDTSWHPLQKNSEVLPVSFRFGMDDGQVVIQLLLLAFTSGWQHLGWNGDFVSPEVFLWHLYEHLLLAIASPTGVLAVFLTINLTAHTPNCHTLAPHSWLQSCSSSQRWWNLNAKHLECLPIPGLCEGCC